MFLDLCLEVYVHSLNTLWDWEPDVDTRSSFRMALNELLRAVPGSICVFALCCNSYCRMNFGWIRTMFLLVGNQLTWEPLSEIALYVKIPSISISLVDTHIALPYVQTSGCAKTIEANQESAYIWSWNTIPSWWYNQDICSARKPASKQVDPDAMGGGVKRSHLGCGTTGGKHIPTSSEMAAILAHLSCSYSGKWIFFCVIDEVSFIKWGCSLILSVDNWQI